MCVYVCALCVLWVNMEYFWQMSEQIEYINLKSVEYFPGEYEAVYEEKRETV